MAAFSAVAVASAEASIPAATTSRAAAFGAATSSSAFREANSRHATSACIKPVRPTPKGVGAMAMEGSKRAPELVDEWLDDMVQHDVDLVVIGLAQLLHPSGFVSPMAANTKGRSRLTWALIPSNRSPMPSTCFPAAARNATRQAGGTWENPTGRKVVICVEIHMRKGDVLMIDKCRVPQKSRLLTEVQVLSVVRR